MATQSRLKGKRIAALVTDGFEQVELTSPREALKTQGAEVSIVSPKRDKVRGWNHDQPADSFDVDVPITEAVASDFDGLLLPGGVQNPDHLRTDAFVQKFVKDFFLQHKPVAAICHGPWTLIDAGVVKGRRMTSYHSVRTDLKNAGAEWVDEQVVVDNGLVTSRNPSDLEAFNAKIVEEYAEGLHEAQHA
ncbi:MAG TPA: type 1 glutamine amidotransferase domain-containing protein [Phycisphaerae bacterium]|nr:type 1 glutamine amidotransferase domain-containing protein [Phycisphaerae bacterium]